MPRICQPVLFANKQGIGLQPDDIRLPLLVVGILGRDNLDRVTLVAQNPREQLDGVCDAVYSWFISLGDKRYFHSNSEGYYIHNLVPRQSFKYFHPIILPIYSL